MDPLKSAPRRPRPAYLLPGLAFMVIGMAPHRSAFLCIGLAFVAMAIAAARRDGRA